METKLPYDLYTDPEWEGRTYAYRGKVIAHFANFEKVIESFLSAEFSSDPRERRKMQSIIFDRMTFESKRTSIKTILLDREIENGFVKTKNKSHPHKQLIEELNSLNSLRNQFAHFPTLQATNREEYSYAIGLVDFRDKTNFKWFTQHEIDSITERISKAQKSVITLTKKRSKK